MTPSPWRAIVQRRRTGPSPSTVSSWCGAARRDEREQEEADADADHEQQRRLRRRRDVRGQRRRRGRAASPARCRRRGARRRFRRASPTRPSAPASSASSTATRASSPMRPGSTAFANSPTENAEKTSVGARMRRRHRLTDHRRPRERARDHGEEVERDRDDDPLPLDLRERGADPGEARAAPPEQRGDPGEHDHAERGPARGRPRQRAAAGASCCEPGRDVAVDLDEPPAIASHE